MGLAGGIHDPNKSTEFERGAEAAWKWVGENVPYAFKYRPEFQRWLNGKVIRGNESLGKQVKA